MALLLGSQSWPSVEPSAWQPGTRQRPATQLAVPVQPLPQKPQSLAEVVRSAQPSWQQAEARPASRSQMAPSRPSGQDVPWQLPFTQGWPAGQAQPQLPPSLASVSGSVQPIGREPTGQDWPTAALSRQY